ncbi:MAG: hypothetical protein LQ352_005377 [Teloschistes flavicans]|nr:MAG: hypothetical protein LQ352_005377 [Teloschistes flavicans]
MTKRKHPAEAGAPKPKRQSKKRVAFTVPKNATTKALITRNATDSPLLRLPLEIRNKIWTEVLGDRLVHIDYYEDDSSFDSDGNFSINKDIPYNESAWRHVICRDDRREDSPPRRVTSNLGGTEHVYWDRAHSICNLDYDRKSFKVLDRQHYDPQDDANWLRCGHDTMRLSILRSSRQIYVEANEILWTTNTFSFTEPIAFKHFMSTRNVHQKRLLRSLRFEQEWFFPECSKGWNNALLLPMVRSLSGLRHLRLHITHSMEATLYESVGVSSLPKWPLNSSFCEGLEKLSILPIQSVEIAMVSPLYGARVGEWTEEQKKEAAGRIRHLLLNPNGAEVYAEAQREQKEWFRKEREREAAIKAQIRREHEEFLARQRRIAEK